MRLAIRNLTIRNVRPGEKEDNLYEGHGIFVIDSRAADGGASRMGWGPSPVARNYTAPDDNDRCGGADYPHT